MDALKTHWLPDKKQGSLKELEAFSFHFDAHEIVSIDLRELICAVTGNPLNRSQDRSGSNARSVIIRHCSLSFNEMDIDSGFKRMLLEPSFDPLASFKGNRAEFGAEMIFEGFCDLINPE